MALQHPLQMEMFVGKTSANGELSIAHVWLQGGNPIFLSLKLPVISVCGNQSSFEITIQNMFENVNHVVISPC
jgi:hypothetical protein